MPQMRARIDHALGLLYGCVACMDDGRMDRRERRTILRRSKAWLSELHELPGNEEAIKAGIAAGIALVQGVATGRSDVDDVTDAVDLLRDLMDADQRLAFVMDLAHVVDATQKGGHEGTARQAAMMHAIRQEMGVSLLGPGPDGLDGEVQPVDGGVIRDAFDGPDVA